MSPPFEEERRRASIPGRFESAEGVGRTAASIRNTMQPVLGIESRLFNAEPVTIPNYLGLYKREV
jgi:hypothetical protein